MKDATLAQGNQVLNLILQKKTPACQLQKLVESGLLSDLLDANVDEVDREKFRAVIGLKVAEPVPPTPFQEAPAVTPQHYKPELSEAERLEREIFLLNALERDGYLPTCIVCNKVVDLKHATTYENLETLFRKRPKYVLHSGCRVRDVGSVFSSTPQPPRLEEIERRMK